MGGSGGGGGREPPLEGGGNPAVRDGGGLDCGGRLGGAWPPGGRLLPVLG
jgi:hypothetical protein